MPLDTIVDDIPFISFSVTNIQNYNFCILIMLPEFLRISLINSTIFYRFLRVLNIRNHVNCE